jgi:flagellar biosynthetic protein FliP
MTKARHVLTLLLVASQASWAQSQSPSSLLGVSLTQSKGSASLGAPMQIVVLLTLFTILPAVIMTVTPFLRITVVLHFLRQALGTQGTPSNQVLIGLALFLTLLIMQPVVSEMYHKGWEPLEQGQVTLQQAFDDGSKPLQAFLIRYVREKDVRLFLDVSHTPAPQRPADLSLTVLVPAYVLSELKTGFQIGAVLFLPFLVIDLVVASVTLSIGMIQLPPVMLSAPFKILLFVLVDGWNLVVGSLVRSFYQT